MTPDQAMQLAVRHHQAGQLAEAEQIYRQVLTQAPEHADAWRLLGALVGQTGHPDSAVQMLSRAVQLRPDDAEAHSNLGNFLRELGRLDEAIAACRRAIELRPDIAEAHNNLGNALNDHKLLDEAIAAYQRAIQLRPDYAEACGNLGLALTVAGRFQEAIAACRRAVRIKDNDADAHWHLGDALRGAGLGAEAIAEYRRAIALQPDFAEAHLNLSLTLLLRGDFQQGWPEFEWRQKTRTHSMSLNFSQPRWNGQGLEGKTILLHAEQGFGDTIQFVRYAPLVAGRGGRVILLCPHDLVRLLDGFAGLQQVIAGGAALPRFDVHCPLLSLPQAMGTDCLAAIPADVPYLRPPSDDQAAWKARFPADDAKLKIGLAWAGQPGHLNDRNRSLPLARFDGLSSVEGVQFYSLQKGDAARQTASSKLPLVDWTSELRDFADTAALIANLDLIISVDTAVAHLAGAMGKPTWVLLPLAPDWRWMMDRDDSPWYPTMRLFRQRRMGDWADVIASMAAQLRIESDLRS
jgi:Flp pilus assembly protein TadD